MEGLQGEKIAVSLPYPLTPGSLPLIVAHVCLPPVTCGSIAFEHNEEAYAILPLNALFLVTPHNQLQFYFKTSYAHTRAILNLIPPPEAFVSLLVSGWRTHPEALTITCAMFPGERVGERRRSSSL